jgi:hypothetical protein
MYLVTTVYRIHGTNRPDTIGTAVSSGWSTPPLPTFMSALRWEPR